MRGFFGEDMIRDSNKRADKWGNRISQEKSSGEQASSSSMKKMIEFDEKHIKIDILVLY